MIQPCLSIVGLLNLLLRSVEVAQKFVCGIWIFLYIIFVSAVRSFQPNVSWILRFRQVCLKRTIFNTQSEMWLLFILYFLLRIWFLSWIHICQVSPILILLQTISQIIVSRSSDVLTNFGHPSLLGWLSVRILSVSVSDLVVYIESFAILFIQLVTWLFGDLVQHLWLLQALHWKIYLIHVTYTCNLTRI